MISRLFGLLGCLSTLLALAALTGLLDVYEGLLWTVESPSIVLASGDVVLVRVSADPSPDGRDLQPRIEVFRACGNEVANLVWARAFAGEVDDMAVTVPEDRGEVGPHAIVVIDRTSGGRMVVELDLRRPVRANVRMASEASEVERAR